MRHRFPTGIILIIALAAGAVGAVVLLRPTVVAFLAPERLRAELVATMSRELGAVVDIAGPVHLSVWPRARLTVEDVSVFNPASYRAAELFTAARVEADLDFFAFISGQPALRRVFVSQPRVTVERDRFGNWNWSQVARHLLDSNRQRGMLVNHSFVELLLRAGTIVVVDPESGDQEEIYVRELSARRQGVGGRWLAALTTSSGAESTQLAGEFLPRQWGERIIDVRNFSYRQGASRVTGNLVLDLHGNVPALVATLDAEAVSLADPWNEWREALSAYQTIVPASEDPAAGNVRDDLLGDLLADAALDITFSGTAIDVGPFAADTLRFRGIQTADRLVISPIRITSGDGAAEGSVEFDTGRAPPVVRANLVAANIQLVPSEIKRLGPVPASLVDIRAELGAVGRSWEELSAGLYGEIHLAWQDTEVPAGSLGRSFARSRGLIFPWLKEDEPLAVVHLEGRVKFVRGVGVIGPLVVETPDIRFDSTGELDFNEGSLHLELTPEVRNLEIVHLAAPLFVAGPLDDLAVLPNPLGGSGNASPFRQ